MTDEPKPITNFLDFIRAIDEPYENPAYSLRRMKADRAKQWLMCANLLTIRKDAREANTLFLETVNAAKPEVAEEMLVDYFDRCFPPIDPLSQLQRDAYNRTVTDYILLKNETDENPPGVPEEPR